MLGVVCASLCIGEEAFRKRSADYQALLERCVLIKYFLYSFIHSFIHCGGYRGQVMNAEMMSNVVDIELIQDGIKYSLKVSPTDMQ